MGRFDEMDEGEQLLGKKAESFSVDDLLPYIQAMSKSRLGHRIYMDGKSRGQIRRLRTMYKSGAGLLLKWLFFQYGGQKDGEDFQMSWFCQANQWWTDRLHAEAVTAHIKRPKVSADNDGFASIRDLQHALAS